MAARPVGTYGRPHSIPHRRAIKRAIQGSDAHRAANRDRGATQRGRMVPHWTLKRPNKRYTAEVCAAQDVARERVEGAACPRCDELQVRITRYNNFLGASGTALCEGCGIQLRWDQERIVERHERV